MRRRRSERASHVRGTSPARRHRWNVSASIGALAVAAATVVGCSGSDESTTQTSQLTGAAAQGQSAVRDLGCTTCHNAEGRDGAGPTFKGLAGSQVQLADGTTVTADDDYLRVAITDPDRQVVDGYSAIMPTRKLTDEQVEQIIAYLDAIGSTSGS